MRSGKIILKYPHHINDAMLVNKHFPLQRKFVLTTLTLAPLLTGCEIDGLTAGPIPSIVDSSSFEAVGSPWTKIFHFFLHCLSWVVSPCEISCHHLWLRELQDDVDERGCPLIREFDVEDD